MYLGKKILANPYSVLIFIIILSTLSILSFFVYGKDYKVTPLSRLDKNYTEKNILNLEEVDKNKIGEDMLIADLTNMKISLAKSGVIVKEFEIVSKGKPGSYYETPAGNYDIKSKENNKLSTLGNVYMPYSMQFYGNFFIHGIPYHPDGTRVSTSYSGGCIRMSDSDAREIYEFSKIGTRLLILNNNISNNLDNLDSLNASNVKSFDQEKSKNILTVLTSLEVLNQEKYITFNKNKIQMKELNKYILENNKEAINIVENNIGINNFINRKLEKANAIGISDFNFNLESDRNILLDYVKNNKSHILGLLN